MEDIMRERTIETSVNVFFYAVVPIIICVLVVKIMKRTKDKGIHNEITETKNNDIPLKITEVPTQRIPRETATREGLKRGSFVLRREELRHHFANICNYSHSRQNNMIIAPLKSKSECDEN